METISTELYHQIKINLSYDDHYLDGAYDAQEQINKLLADWIKKEKPVSYHLLNAQTLFINQLEIYGNNMPPIIQHILHISFVKEV